MGLYLSTLKALALFPPSSSFATANTSAAQHSATPSTSSADVPLPADPRAGEFHQHEDRQEEAPVHLAASSRRTFSTPPTAAPADARTPAYDPFCTTAGPGRNLSAACAPLPPAAPLGYDEIAYGARIHASKTDLAEAAYSWQRDSPILLGPELANLLHRPRWPCFWGEEFTGELSPGSEEELAESLSSGGESGYGYRTCGLRRLWKSEEFAKNPPQNSGGQAPCVVYSFGSNGDFEFERAIARIYGFHCEIHIFDLGDPLPIGGAAANPSKNEFTVSEAERRAVIANAFGHENAIVTYHNMAVWDKDGVEWVSAWENAQPLLFGTKTVPGIMKVLGHKGRVSRFGNESVDPTAALLLATAPLLFFWIC